MIYKFYKEADGGWFIDIPGFIEEGHGTQGDLAMVCGADKFLDKLDVITVASADLENGEYVVVYKNIPGDGIVKLDVEITPAEGHQVLQFIEDGWYVELKTGHLMWLCGVTVWLFGEYPKYIYFKKV